MIADTCIWLDALGAGALDPSPFRSELATLIREDRIIMLGLIRQEILSGIGDANRFEQVKNALKSFPDEPLTSSDHENAAEYFRIARLQRIKTSFSDCLMSAVAVRVEAKLFTLDKHFFLLQKHLPLRLHHV